MQQIYKNYNGEFEEKLETFNRSVNLSINYRTTPKIVDILNYIYNDEALKQYPYEKNSNNTMAFSPKVLIVNDVEAIGAIDAEAFMERIDMPVFSNNDRKTCCM